MQTQSYYALGLLLAGLVTTAVGARALFDPTFARTYVRSSPKAVVLRKLLGEERAYVALRRVFAPLAMSMGVLMVVAAAYLWLSRVS